VRSIIAYLYKHPVVRSVDIREFIEEPEVQLLYARVILIDKTLLYVREVLTAEDDKYSYHWQTESGELIRRWDNAPHWQQEINSVHHVHMAQADVVKPSSRVTIQEILEIIAEVINGKR
jgi:hypothetical protein